MGKAKVFRNLETAEDRRFWQSVERAAEEVRSWPAWKRGDSVEKVTPELKLLIEKRAFLEGCLLAAKEELQNKTEEFEARKEKVLSKIKIEIKGYRKKINLIDNLMKKAPKKSDQSPSPANRKNITKTASHIVDSWSLSKRAAFEQRTGLKLPDKKLK